MGVNEIERVAVIGAGIMGQGIAQNFACSRFSVHLLDESEKILSEGLRQIGNNVRLLSEFGLVKDEASSVQSRISVFVSNNLDKAIKNCQIVIETIPEILQVKRDLFMKLDSCPDDVILASNTGTFTVSAITEGMRTPWRVVGLHYFNPAHIMPLVEVHRGKDTTDAVVETARQLMVKVGKKPILVRKEILGFVVNRIQAAMGRELEYLISEGVVTPEDLDIAAKASYGFRLATFGPLEQQDLIGLDTIMRGRKESYKALSNATEPAPCIVEKVSKGELGVKSGKGWYDYGGKSKAQILEERDRKLLEQLILFNRWNS